ncbi:MAG TPA: HAMP domain-containing sensor histidine kinase [Vicinamibacteria bacterium]|nr:HAMP domain-containing sensor histidine kinase [Vicinamibacteria bacterium]
MAAAGGGARLAAVPQSPWSPGDEGRARLVEAARLANVGRLVPAVAHQLATPLASISLRAESLESDLQGPEGAVPRDKLDRYLRAISVETLRCQELLATLRVFARPPDPAFGEVDVNALCRGAAALVLHEAMRRQIEVQLDLDKALPSIRGCEGRLGQAVLSLLMNGLDASPAAGRVVLETRVDGPGEVVVTVTDEGPGVSDDVRLRLFEQPADRGPGLALFACRLIAEQHAGSIECATGHGRGGRFVLRISSGSRQGEHDDERA